MFARLRSKVFDHYEYDLEAKVPTVLYALKDGANPATQKIGKSSKNMTLGLGALVGNAREHV